MFLLQEATVNADEQPGNTELNSENELSETLSPSGSVFSDAVASSARLDLYTIPEKPSQPIISFPQCNTGKQKRSSCTSWYTRYP